ncbi:MAG: DUF3592 domain-containing protein [Myxococcota bacterium]
MGHPEGAQQTSVAASSQAGTGPREVVWAGRGLRPSAVIMAVLGLIAPSMATPLLILWLDPEPGVDVGFAFIPSLVWGALGALCLWFGAVKPLRQRRLVQHGLVTTGEVTDLVEHKRGRQTECTITYAFTPQHSTERRQATQKSSRAIPVGTRVDVVYQPQDPAVSTVVELCDYRPREPGPTPRTQPTAARIAAILALTFLTPFSMLAAELDGERILPDEAGQPFQALKVALLLGVVGGVVRIFQRVRRGRTTSNVALWDGLLLFAAALASFSGLVTLNRVLPSEEQVRTLVVEANFCLRIRERPSSCLLELRTPPELARLHLVRASPPTESGLPARSRVGEVVELRYRAGGLGLPYLTAATSAEMRNAVRSSEKSIAGIPLNKSKVMGDAVRDGEVDALGFFSPQSTARQELHALRVSVREP